MSTLCAGGDVGPNMVYGLATVGVHVGVAFPAFYEILRFTFYANCAFLIPVAPESNQVRVRWASLARPLDPPLLLPGAKLVEAQLFLVFD